MKKILLIVCCALVALGFFVQNWKANQENQEHLADIQKSIKGLDTRLKKSDRYKIYPTENIYNLLLLDTATGTIDQVQWSLEEEKEFSVTVNSTDLSSDEGHSNFELYPTKNFYQFILLDKTTGRKWHVQWGMDESHRWIRRIN